VAIVGAAWLDLVLLDAISRQLPRGDVGATKALFEGPLQAFGARIHLGYSLNVYGDGIYQDLATIKEIRNAFAHSAEAMAFDDDDVAELVGTMNSPKKVKYQGQPEPVTPRERYVRAVEIVADLLLSDMSRRATGSSAEAILQMAGRRDRAQ
jgi:DNA-binding MltR family transcriptional regulator